MHWLLRSRLWVALTFGVLLLVLDVGRSIWAQWAWLIQAPSTGRLSCWHGEFRNNRIPCRTSHFRAGARRNERLEPLPSPPVPISLSPGSWHELRHCLNVVIECDEPCRAAKQAARRATRRA